jgi:hypothetical protein
MIDFSDSRVGSFEEEVATLKADLAVVPARSRFELGFGGYGTAYVVSSTARYKPSFFGAGARAGYALVSRPTWRWMLFLGWGFSTMTGESFGYTMMPAPVVRSAVRKMLGRRFGVGVYVKYAPARVDGSFSFDESVELAAGGDLAYATGAIESSRPPKAVFVALDVARYSLLIGGVRIRSNSQSLSLGMRF